MDIAAIRTELALRLKTALPGTQGQTMPYGDGNPALPSLVVLGQDESEYDTGGMGEGQDDLVLVIQGYAGKTSERGAHMLIDKWLASSGSNSVKAAIESERPLSVTLGSLVAYARVTKHSGIQFYTLSNGTEVIGAQFTLELSS